MIFGILDAFIWAPFEGLKDNVVADAGLEVSYILLGRFRPPIGPV